MLDISHMKKSIKLSFIFSLITYLILAQDQKQVDSVLTLLPNQKGSSLIQSYIHLSRIHLNSDSELCHYYAETAYNEAKKLKEPSLIAESSLSYGIALGNDSKLEASIQKLEEGLKIFEALGRTRDIYHTISTIGFIQTRIGLFEEAITSHIKAIKLAEADINVDPYSLGNYYLRISNTYGDYGKIDTSNDYLKKAEKVFKDNGYDLMSIYVLSNIGVNLNDTKRYKEAIPYFEKALTYYEKNNLILDLAMDSNNLGNSYFELGQLDEAQKQYQNALKYNENRDDWYITLTLKNLGLIEYTKGNFENALVYYRNALKNAESNEKKDFLALTYRDIADAYAGYGNYKNAFEYSRKYNVLNSEIFSEQSDAKINELEIKYQTEKKAQEIINQKNEIDLLNTKNRVNNLQKWLLGLGFLFAVLGLYALYQRNKRNKLAKENAQAELEYKKKELTTHALHLAKKNEVLNDLKDKAKVFKADANADPGYQMLIQTINFDLQDDNNWENFRKYFEEVHKDFNANAQQKFPNITTNDLRLMALMKMNLSSKEIANILNISSDGIKKARQRLRKKMGIDSNASLEATIIAI